MKLEDVKVGMKVVPHGKILCNETYGGFDKWSNMTENVPCFLKENGYLYVHNIDEDDDMRNVNLSISVDIYGDWFNHSDFEPYTEPKQSYVWAEETTDSPIQYDTTLDAEWVGGRSIPYPNANTIEYAKKYYDRWLGVRIAYIEGIRESYKRVCPEGDFEKDITDTLGWTDDAVVRQVLKALGVVDNDHTFRIVSDGLIECAEFNDVFEELKEEGWVL